MRVKMTHLANPDTVVSGEAVYENNGLVYIQFIGYVSKDNMLIEWLPEADMPPLLLTLKSGRETYGCRASKRSNYYLTDMGRISIGEVSKVRPLDGPPLKTEMLELIRASFQ